MKNKIISLFLSLTLCVAPCLSSASAKSNGIRNISSQRMVSELRNGINIGNSLDSVLNKEGQTVERYETCWGNPQITEDVIKTYKEAGIKTIRLPVTWGMKFGPAPNYEIRKDWMDRVQEVVDMIIDNDMYCILNTHHDQIWINTQSTYSEETHDAFGAVWKQIAERFKDYDEHLLFEAYNEILKKESDWSTPVPKDFEHANALHQTFVDAVRSTGGNNADRFLVVSTYGAHSSEMYMKRLQIPEDTAKDKLIAQVHCYPDTSLSMELNEYAIYDMLNNIERIFADKNVPVIIGELGFAFEASKDQNDINHIIKYLTKTAKSKGITCILWENGYSGSQTDSFGIMDRKSAKIVNKEFLDGFINNSYTYGDINDDGKVTSFDLYQIKLQLLGIYKISDKFITNALVDDSKELSADDLLNLKKHILKVK